MQFGLKYCSKVMFVASEHADIACDCIWDQCGPGQGHCCLKQKKQLFSAQTLEFA